MAFQRCSVRDFVTLTSREITPEGYLLAPGKISRTGVQEYRARELGLDKQGVDGDRIIRLLRPADEVFSQATMDSFGDKPITLNHPPEGVNSTNWRQRAVGDVREVARDADHVGAKLAIRDKAAVSAVVDGKSQLSCGYAFDCDMTPGKTADGQSYDGVQRNIRGNHIAIVDVARGGAGCRVADTEQGDRTMATRTIVVDGISIELESTQASLVEKIVGDSAKARKTAEDAAVEATKRADASDKALADEKAGRTKDATDAAAKLTEAEGKILKPDQIKLLVAEQVKAVGDAAKLAPDFKITADSAHAIRAEVLAHVVAKDEAIKSIVTAGLGGVELAKAPEATVRTVFDMAVASKGLRPAKGGKGPSEADLAAGRAIVGADGTNRSSALDGRDLFLYRETHGGQDPVQQSA